MLDGQHGNLRTYMASNEAEGKAVTFLALNKDEAREMLESEGLGHYKIMWESTPLTQHKELTKNAEGEYELKTKKADS